MSATPPPGYTPPPADLPQRGVRATFSNLMDTWITWFSATVLAQVAAMVANAYANAVEAFTCAMDAQTSALAASNSALAAAVYANAPMWVSGATYAIGDPVTDPTDTQVYKRRVAGAGTTRPGLDPAKWQPAGAELDDEIHVLAGNGFGSTNTYVRRFSTVKTNSGAALSYSDSATLGGYITVNQSGLYSIFASDTWQSPGGGAGVQATGATLNATGAQLANPPRALSDAVGIGSVFATIGAFEVLALNVTRVVKLNAGDVIRLQSEPTYAIGGLKETALAVRKLANLI